MTDPLRPTLIAPSLRKIAARAGAAIAPQVTRRRSATAPDQVIIEGRAEPLDQTAAGDPGPASARGAEAYRTAAQAAPRSRRSAPEAGAEGDFRLVRAPVDLTDGKMVEEFLPDILGRALARSWVDAGFRSRLTQDPKALLADHDVHLPGSIRIETQTGPNGRPLVVVHERQPDGGMRRLCYLQLVMLAGK